jgi:hypothetical protein
VCALNKRLGKREINAQTIILIHPNLGLHQVPTLREFVHYDL